MKNDPASNNNTSLHGRDKGERVWHATRLEGVVRNTGIKPVKKKERGTK